MANNKEFGKQLEERTKRFAIDAIKLTEKLPANRTGDVIRYQLVKSATSIGANYREANRAISRADFKHRISVCDKEASESQYWLEIIDEMNWGKKEDVKKVLSECNELVALFTSIRRSTQK